MDVDSKRRASVGQSDRAAGVTQIIRPSTSFPWPMVPVSPKTVMVIVDPRLEAEVDVIESTLLAAALMVSATSTKL